MGFSITRIVYYTPRRVVTWKLMFDILSFFCFFLLHVSVSQDFLANLAKTIFFIFFSRPVFIYTTVCEMTMIPPMFWRVPIFFYFYAISRRSVYLILRLVFFWKYDQVVLLTIISCVLTIYILIHFLKLNI